MSETPEQASEALIRRFERLFEALADRTTLVVTGQSEDLASIQSALEALAADFAAFRADVLRQREMNADAGRAQDAAIAAMGEQLVGLEQRLMSQTDYLEEARTARREIVEGLRALTREIRGESTP